MCASVCLFLPPFDISICSRYRFFFPVAGFDFEMSMNNLFCNLDSDGWALDKGREILRGEGS